jgi:hypothetical protein
MARSIFSFSALIIFLLISSIAYSLSSKPIASPPAISDRPLINNSASKSVIQNIDFNFDQVNEGEIIKKEFTFPDKIVKVISSCDCIKTAVSGNMLMLAINTFGEKGDFFRYMYIETQNTKYKIIVSGEVQAKNKKFSDFIEKL